MRLQELYIKDYKVLQDFTLTFDEESSVSVLIGENGSGKSTVLEAIAIIFNELSLYLDNKLREQPLFEYSIIYMIWNRLPLADLTEGSDQTQQLSVKVNYTYEIGYKFQISDKFVTVNDFKRRHANKSLLPSKIFLYYSGLSSYLADLAAQRNELYSKELRRQKLDLEKYSPPKERLLHYISPQHHAISLLCQLIANEDESLSSPIGQEIGGKYVLEEVRIVLRKTPKFRSSENYEQFWGAEGALKAFMQLLSRYADLGRPDLPYGEKKSLNELTLSYTGLLGLRDIQNQSSLSNYEFAITLFHLLESLHYEGYLLKVDLTFSWADKRIEYNRLSEGERHRYTILALSYLFNQEYEENNIFLLDEPDAYFHPRWQIRFIRAIQDDVSPFNQCVIATHSPLLLNYADRQHVHVQQLAQGQVVDYTPRYAGRDIATVLYELMGVEERPAETRYQLASLFSFIEDENIVDARTLLNRIAATVGADDPEIIKAQVEIDLLERLNATDNKE